MEFEHYSLGIRARDYTLALIFLDPEYKDGQYSARWVACVEEVSRDDDVVIPVGNQNVFFKPSRDIPKGGGFKFEPVTFTYSNTNLTSILEPGQD
jgi:hypothetical protein